MEFLRIIVWRTHEVIDNNDIGFTFGYNFFQFVSFAIILAIISSKKLTFDVIFNFSIDEIPESKPDLIKV